MRTADVKIVVVARDVVGTGGGTVALETAAYFARQGCQVRLITDDVLDDCPPGVHHEPVVPPRPFRRDKGRNKLLFAARKFANLLAFSFLARRRLSQLESEGFVSIDHNCEAFGADIVVAHNVFSAQAAADKRPWLRRLPQRLNPVSVFRIARERMVLSASRTASIVAVSQSTRQELAPFAEPSRIATITSGIDAKHFSPDIAQRNATRSRLSAGTAFVLAFIGHEFERKRLDLVIASLAMLPNNVVLWVAGGRFSDENAYKRMASDNGVAERITFWGPTADAAQLLRAADIFVLPSDYETWGLVCIEAMASGLPVIMTRVGCAEYVIQDGVTGFICESSATDIADKVSRILADPESHRAMGAAARQEALKHDWDATGKAYLELVISVAERRKV